jgi:putative peptide zinc metalloprotease protein
VLFSERSTNRIGRALAWLHHPLAAVPVLGAMLGFDVWLFGVHGAVPTLLQTLDQPISLLAVFALTLTSMLFHEFGHASAASYGKARPGCIGAGLFLIWPSVYTDVTDVYRLGRLGRLRTDFGGTYFNIVFMVCLGACYALTGQPLFLATVLLIHMELLEQLTPAIRLDGYYILGDMAGVPDLFGKISPILLSFVPGRAPSPTVAGLKRSARVTVAAWILAMVILQGSFSGYIAWNLPRIVSTASHSLVAQLTGTASTFTHGHIGDGMLGILGSLMLILSIFGLAYLSLVLVGRLLRSAVRGSQRRPQLRATAGAAMLIVAVSVAIVLTSASTPQPLPELPPLVPVLQPGVPTTEPAGPTESQPHSSPSSTEPSVVHPTHSAELRRLTRHLEVQSTIVSP